MFAITNYLVNVLSNITIKTNMPNALIVTQLLMLAVFLLGSVFIIKFHWRRREMYRLASKITDAFPSYPIIGSAHYFLGPIGEFQNMVNKKLDKFYPSLVKLWLGPTLYVAISNPEHLEVILNHKHCLNKSDKYVHFEMLGGQGLVTAKANLWKKNRKLIQPTFNQKVLNQFVPTFVKSSETFIDILKKYVGKGEFDVFLPVSLCSLDSILETAIGLKVDVQTTNFQYPKWLSTVFESSMLRILYLPYNYDFIFNLSAQGKACSESLTKVKEFIGTVVEEKRKTFEENQNTLDFRDSGRQKAFLDLLLELEDKGTHFTNKQISDEVHTMVAAATDTTAAALSFMFIMLGMFPNLQQKVYDEVIDVIGQNRSITANDLPKLKYMEMFIKETLRLFPSGPHMSRQPSQNIRLGTTVIPANTSFYISILHTHRNGLIWTDPLKFDPDRFLPEESAKRHPYSYVPFSGGPRSCIGLKYAMMMIKTVMATIIRKYEINTSYKTVEDIEISTHAILRATKGYNVSIEERHS